MPQPMRNAHDAAVQAHIKHDQQRLNSQRSTWVVWSRGFTRSFPPSFLQEIKPEQANGSATPD